MVKELAYTKTKQLFIGLETRMCIGLLEKTYFICAFRLYLGYVTIIESSSFYELTYTALGYRPIFSPQRIRSVSTQLYTTEHVKQGILCDAKYVAVLFTHFSCPLNGFSLNIKEITSNTETIYYSGKQ